MLDSASLTRSTSVHGDYMDEVSSSHQPFLLEYYPQQQFGGGVPVHHFQQQADFSTYAQNPQDEATDEAPQHDFYTYDQNSQHEPMDEAPQDQWRGDRPWTMPEDEEASERVASGEPFASTRARAAKVNIIDPYMTGSTRGGPEVPTLMRSFTDHVAYNIYKGISRQFSFQFRHTCVRAWTREANSPGELAATAAGLDHIPSLMYEHVDKQLVTAFIERWQPEPNLFHLPFGEMTITLHDVHILMMLPIIGRGMGFTAEQWLKGKMVALSHKLS